MGDSDKAVEVYSKIAAANPADMVAVKRSKDAAATATMKKGGWEKEGSFKDKLANKEEAAALEQKSRIVRSAESIDELIAELYPVWEADQSHVDNSKKLAKLYEERYGVGPTPEGLDGAIYFYHHCDTILNGSDPGVQRKLSDLQMKKTEDEIKMWEDHVAANEAWLQGEGAEGSEDDRTAAQQAVEDAKNAAAELRKGRAELLIGEARKRIERNPTDLQLRYELGELLVGAGQYTEAIEQLQRARQNPNARIKAMRYLGVCFKEKGMLDFAAKQLKEASSEMLAMDVTKKEILYELGLVYELMGKKDEALACFKEIYEVDYGYRDVAQRVESSYGG
jgi:tetratricopeptide (TPR) repeat protein